MSEDPQSLGFLKVENKKDQSQKSSKHPINVSCSINFRRASIQKKNALPIIPNMTSTLNPNTLGNQSHTSRPPSNFSFTRRSQSNNQFQKKNINQYSHKISTNRNTSYSDMEYSKTSKISIFSENNDPNQTRVDPCLYLSSEMDEFFLLLSHETLQTSVEAYCQERLNAGQVIFWRAIASVQRFYSNKLNMSIAHNEGLIGFSFNSRTIVVVPVANKHEFFDPKVDGLVINPTSSLVFFPLFDSMNNLVSIVEVSKKANDSTVSKSDYRFIETFQRKFRTFSHWILNDDDHNDEEYKELLNLMEPGQFVLLFKRKMAEIFQCRLAEIWVYSELARSESETESKFVLYNENGSTQIETSKVGLVGEIIHKEQVYNCFLSNRQSSYNAETDGKIEEPVLAMPYSVTESNGKKVYVIMIRGQNKKKIFTTYDERKLTRISKFIFSSFINSLYIDELNNSSAGNEKLIQSLLRVIPKVKERKRPEDVLESSMRELKLFTKADRVSYFEIDRERNILRSCFNEGMKDKIQVPIGTGQCGIAALRGVVLNTANAYAEKFFDPVFDKITKYRTKTLLSVPIITSSGGVGAVIQLLNKQDSKPFSDNDIAVSQIFGSVCMCLLSSSSLFSDLNDSSRRLIELTNTIDSLLSSDNAYSKIVESACSALQCEFVTFYTFDEADLLFHPISTSCSATAASRHSSKKPFSDISSLHGIAEQIIKEKNTFFINDVKNHDALSDENPEEKEIMISVLICPVLNKNKNVIGMIRAINKRGLFDRNDAKTIESYSILLSIKHEDDKLRKIIKNGPVQIKIDKWISINESGSSCIPRMLRISDVQSSKMENLDFNIQEWNNNGMYQIMFHVFGSLGLLSRFKISNTTLYSFLFDCKNEFDRNKLKYHNWLHCVEMVQFFSYMSKATQLGSTLHARDLFAIIIALIFSYISNDGLNNLFHSKVKTPLGLALPSNSVLETASMIKLIQIMQQEKSNLMANMNDEDKKYVWDLTFKLISFSDLNQKFEVIEKAEERFKSATLDMINNNDRWSLIILFFRASLMSTYCRPFLISQKWHDLEIAEMIDLGDKEEKAKIDYSSLYCCGEMCKKINHAVEQLEQKVLPLFNILQKGMPDLIDSYSSAQSNLKTWNHIKSTKNSDTK